MQHEENDAQEAQAEIRRKRKISTFWLLPVIAIFIASWLLFQHWQDKGVQITIDFQSASGIVSGRTPIRYQGVDVGIVKDVTLSDDLRRVIVTANVRKDVATALRKNTQFWLVTPKASLSGVSGLDALLGVTTLACYRVMAKNSSHLLPKKCVLKLILIKTNN